MAENAAELAYRERKRAEMAREHEEKRTGAFEVRTGGKIAKRRHGQPFKLDHYEERQAAKARAKMDQFLAAEAKEPEKGAEPLSVDEELERKGRQVGIDPSLERDIWFDWKARMLEDDPSYDFSSPEAQQAWDKYLEEQSRAAEEERKEYVRFKKIDQEMRRPGSHRPSYAKGATRAIRIKS